MVGMKNTDYSRQFLMPVFLYLYFAQLDLAIWQKSTVLLGCGSLLLAGRFYLSFIARNQGNGNAHYPNDRNHIGYFILYELFDLQRRTRQAISRFRRKFRPRTIPNFKKSEIWRAK